MGGYGITMVGYFEGDKLNKRKIRRPRTPWQGWVCNTSFDVEEEGKPTSSWKDLMDGKTTSTKLLDEILKEKVRLRKIDVFEDNSNIVDVHKLYNFNGPCYCAFIPNKTTWMLLQVGVKTIEELKVVGVDSNKKSNVPLIIGVDKEKDLKFILNPV